MKYLSKIIIGLALAALVVNRNQIIEQFNLMTTEKEVRLEIIEEPMLSKEQEVELESEKPKGDHFINDSLYRWDTTYFDWVAVEVLEKISEETPTAMFTSLKKDNQGNKPIVIDWPLLLDIKYKLKYFEEFDMEIYSPVFTDALKAINGKEVIIEGFVIPFDETGELISLSANPYAACFFCGKASPASVISLYVKKKKLYKMDDFRKFRGILELNYDDPNEYYYILRSAVPLK